MTSVFNRLAPATGWQESFDDIGYYVHKGRAYMSGVALSTSDGLTTSTILNVPGAIRPRVPITFTLPTTADSTPTRDAALAFADSYSATLNPDGSLVLASLPPQVVTTPDIATYYWFGVLHGPHPRYLRPMYLGLLLGGMSWALTSEADTITPASMAAHVDTFYFTDIDSGYEVHDERVHLTGSVRANVDGANRVFSSLPPEALGGFVGSDTVDSAATGGGRTFPIGFVGVGGGRGFLDSDPSIKPAADPPPLSWACPSGQTGADDAYLGGGPGRPPIGQNFISGAPYSGELQFSEHVDHGTYVCSDGVDDATCRTPGTVSAFTFDIDTLLAQCDPLPDWFMLQFFYTVRTRNPANDGACHGSDFCGPLIDPGFTISITMSAAHLNLDASSNPVTPVLDSIEAFLAPASPLYTGLPQLPGTGYPSDQPALIWKYGQVSGTISVVPSASINVADPGGALLLLPLYETRQYGLHAGDVLDLTGAGWPGVPPAPTPVSPGTLIFGSPDTGIIRRGSQ